MRRPYPRDFSLLARIQAKRRADEPMLETDSYRVWDGGGLSAEERAEAKKISLAVGAGGR